MYLKDRLYSFYYGGVLNLSHKKIVAVLVSKIQWNAMIGCDYDLHQLQIITYNKISGKKLDSKVVSKDNDCWISETNFIENKIEVKQIRIFEANKPKLRSELEINNYEIDKSGKIKKIKKSSKQEIFMYYDTTENNFKQIK